MVTAELCRPHLQLSAGELTWGCIESVFAVLDVGGNPENLSFIAVFCLHLGKEGGCTNCRSWLPYTLVAALNIVIQSLLDVLVEVQETGEEYIGQTKTSRSGKQA